MATTKITVGNVDILALSDGVLEFDLCNFFPSIPPTDWQSYAHHLTADHHVQFNLGSFLIRSDGQTILVDTGMGQSRRMRRRRPGANSWTILPPMRSVLKRSTWSC